MAPMETSNPSALPRVPTWALSNPGLGISRARSSFHGHPSAGATGCAFQSSNFRNFPTPLWHFLEIQEPYSPPDCSLVHALDLLCPACLRPHGTYCKVCVDMLTACLANKTPPSASGSSTVHVTRATSYIIALKPACRAADVTGVHTKDRAAEQERGVARINRCFFRWTHTQLAGEFFCRPWAAAALAHRTPHRPSHLPTPSRGGHGWCLGDAMCDGVGVANLGGWILKWPKTDMKL